jgi:hypothetical protein
VTQLTYHLPLLSILLYFLPYSTLLVLDSSSTHTPMPKSGQLYANNQLILK